MSDKSRYAPGSDEPHSRETSTLTSSSRDSLREGKTAHRSDESNSPPMPVIGIADMALGVSGTSVMRNTQPTSVIDEHRLPLFNESGGLPDMGIPGDGAVMVPARGQVQHDVMSNGLKLGEPNIAPINQDRSTSCYNLMIENTAIRPNMPHEFPPQNRDGRYVPPLGNAREKDVYESTSNEDKSTHDTNSEWTTVLSNAEKRERRKANISPGKNVNSKFHSILTLNVNSIDQKKYSYLVEFLKKKTNSIVAITELVNTQSELNNLLSQNSKFPILNHDSAKRVGLMIPKYLESCFVIVDTFNVKQARKRKSQNVCETTTFKFTYGKIIEVITVVYCAPDATTNSRSILRTKLLEYSRKFTNYLAIGDFNSDFKIKKNRDEYKADLGGVLTQIVKDPTRHAEKLIGQSKRASDTLIDLAFASDSMKARLVDIPKIHSDSPSDHHMVECIFDINVPKKCVTYEYYLDPTRRPPMKGAVLETVKREIGSIFESDMIEMASMEQHEIIAHVQTTVKRVLDIHNPLNTSELYKKKIYAFPMSRSLLNLKKYRNTLYNEYRYSKRRSFPNQKIRERYEKYKKVRNEFTSKKREEQTAYKVSIINDGLGNSKHIWDFIKKFQPDKHIDTSKSVVSIDGFEGTALANKMARYLENRAKLVPSEDIAKCSEFIPYPKKSPTEKVHFNDDTKYDVKTLFNTKKKPNYSCGPDTISLKHVNDLMPVIKPVLQTAIDKPLTSFVDIQHNFNRLISKETISINEPLTEKSQRPIAELDTIPKYMSIKVFIDKLKTVLIPLMKGNQYSFPGKGSPMAIVKILDTFAMHSALKNKTILAIWDFSNAFCTIIHDVIMKIAKSYNLSENILKLLSQFLEQSFSIIKMSDKNGFYQSDEIHTGVGGQQGQIGSDFIFALANENIDPEKLFDEFIERIKYVDDFNDIMASKNIGELLKSLEHNIQLLLKMAASVGLKLNDSKTKLLFAHLTDEETRKALSLVVPLENLEQSLLDSKTYTHKLLGFNFSIRNNKISVESAIDSIIDRLNGSSRIVTSMRKHGSSLQKTKLRIDIATKLVWSSCYDIGLCYAYANKAQFERIEKCIRKVIKASGLDWMTSSDIVYQISTRLPPRIMAVKQILQLGIKFLDPDEVRRKRFNVPRSDTDSLKPFWKVFLSEFEKLPLKLRESIIDLLDPTDVAKMDRIKSSLKSYFLKQVYTYGEPSPKKIDALISKNIYSHIIVAERKRKYEENRQRVNFSTPEAKRFRLGSKLNMRKISKCLAPRVSKCRQAYRASLASFQNVNLRGPGKKKEPPDKSLDTPRRPSKRSNTEHTLHN